MAFDTFVRISGIDGESTDDQHTGWIEAYNYAWSVRQPVSSTTSSAGGATTGRVDFKPFNFAKHLDKASPKLALACADGTHIDEIVVEVCRAGGDRVKFMTYRLCNCIISKLSTIGGGIFPMESVNIDYGSSEGGNQLYCFLGSWIDYRRINHYCGWTISSGNFFWYSDELYS